MALKNFMSTRNESDGLAESERATGNAANRQSAASERPPREIAPSTSVDAGSVLEGKLHCKEILRIDGRVIGEVKCEKVAIIGECANVEANITADVVQVSGKVKGNITATSKITLSRSARMTGDLVTPGIVIEEGAKLQGQIMIGSDDKVAQQSKSDDKAEQQPKSDDEAAPESKPAEKATPGKKSRQSESAGATAPPA